MKQSTRLEKILMDLPEELKPHYIDVLNGKTQEEEDVPPEFYTAWEMEEALKGETKPFIYSTGWAELNGMAAGGIAAGETILCAAQAGMGKTHFAVNLAANMAFDGHPVFYLTMEDGYKMIVDRLKSLGVTEKVKRNVIVMKEDELTLKNALPTLKRAISDAHMIIIDNLFSLPLRQTAKGDYWTSQAEWVDDLCNMVRSTDSTCLVLHHLNKSKEQGGAERWQVAGSTRIVNRVAQVWLLYRSDSEPTVIGIKSAKNRRSPMKGECYLKSGLNGVLYDSSPDLNKRLGKFVKEDFGIVI